MVFRAVSITSSKSTSATDEPNDSEFYADAAQKPREIPKKNTTRKNSTNQ